MRASLPFLLLLGLSLVPGLAGADDHGSPKDRALSGAKEASKDVAGAAGASLLKAALL